MAGSIRARRIRARHGSEERLAHVRAARPRLDRAVAATILCCSVLVACAGAGPGASGRDVRVGAVQGRGGAVVTQVELQQDVERFVSEFMFDVAQATRPLEESSDPARRLLGQRRALIYFATALDIASGPYPELNLVDMLVFVSLGRRALEDHWVPHELADEGRPLLEVFTRSEQRLWLLSGKILSPEQQRSVRDLLANWWERHPETVLVEGVRFEQFAYRVGEVAEERAARARGLFGQIRSAARTADEALLLGERALFLAHRLPFLMRMQARVGAQEVLSDSLANLGDVQALLERAPELRPLLDELVVLASHAGSAAREGRLLAEASGPLLDRIVGPAAANGPLARRPTETEPSGQPSVGVPPTDVLSRLDRITERSETMLREARELLPHDPEAAATAVERRVDGLARRIALYALAVGFAWAVFFWTGYYLVKR